MFSLTEDVKRAMLATMALDEGQVSEIAVTALTEDISNWSKERFAELKSIPGPSAAYAAWRVVQDFKVPDAIAIERVLNIPEIPPYLGRPEDYDPRDRAQYYTVPDSDQMFRWDGKRTAMLPYGKRRPVIHMPHVMIQGLEIPDPGQSSTVIKMAKRLEADWFHRGYGCWVNPSGKPYPTVDRNLRDRVIRAIRSVQDNGYVTAA